MPYDQFKELTVEKSDKIALVTLNRPEKLNAIGLELHVELEDVFSALTKDQEVKAIVLTGAGRAFSAGGDLQMLRELARNPSIPRITMHMGLQLVHRLLEVEQPIIAAVNGHAIGLGATLALFCDVVFAADNARISDPHVNIGVVPGDGGAVIWPMLIGVARAKQYLMTGDALVATDAERIGLINKAVPQEELLPTAMAFAQRLANGPTQAIFGTKASVNQHLKQQVNLVFLPSMALEQNCLLTSDHVEAVDALIEKRAPHFTGR